MTFRDRVDAGRALARALTDTQHDDVVVLGLPRGGVPVAYEIARVLRAPLDVLLVHKLGLPHQPEVAMGAIGEGGIRFLNPNIMDAGQVTPQELDLVERRERVELDRRGRRFRGEAPAVDLTGRTAIVVDDGIATGATARAACRLARTRGATRVVLAVPVASPSALAELRGSVDAVLCLESPDPFRSVGESYSDFGPTSDEEVVTLLRRSRGEGIGGTATPGSPREQPVRSGVDRAVRVPVAPYTLEGRLSVPENPLGLVVFSHGGAGSWLNPRHLFVARALRDAGLATLVLDLLTVEEECDRSLVFHTEMLARRLAAATAWARGERECADLPIGYFGDSTGAAAALWASAYPGAGIKAVVCRGGRTDLAGPRLAAVTAATLLIVADGDRGVLELNRRARDGLSCERRLAVVPAADHLFENPGALERVAELGRDWFLRYLPVPGGPNSRIDAGSIAEQGPAAIGAAPRL
jgi:putative phosphoribosyl transferase